MGEFKTHIFFLSTGPRKDYKEYCDLHFARIKNPKTDVEYFGKQALNKIRKENEAKGILKKTFDTTISLWKTLGKEVSDVIFSIPIIADKLEERSSEEPKRVEVFKKNEIAW